MKNLMKMSFAIFIILISCVLISCDKNQQTSDSVSQMYRVTCIIPHKDDKAYWSVIEAGLIDGAIDNNIDLKILYPSLNYNTAQMQKLLEMAIASKVDCLIISGVEDPSYYETIQEAIDNGIFVVLVDTDMQKLPNTLYVGSNNYQAGKLLGENVAKIKNYEANIAIISGDDVFYNLNKRFEGLKSVVDNYSNMNIIDIQYDKFDYGKVQQIYDSYRTNPSIDTIVCLEGTGGMSLNSYIKEKPRDDIFVFDDTPQAVEGVTNKLFRGLLKQQKYEMGYRVMQEIAKYREKNQIDLVKIYTDTIFVGASSD